MYKRNKARYDSLLSKYSVQIVKFIILALTVQEQKHAQYT